MKKFVKLCLYNYFQFDEIFFNFSDEYLKKCNEPKKIETPSPVQQPPASRNPALYDTASLKALLPAAQKHLVSSGSGSERFSSPISQVCQSLSKINLQPSLERSYVKNDIEDQIKIKTAWPSTSSPEAVEVVRRRKKSEASADTNLNLINNNGSSTEDMSLKRRSYHPQDYLSKVLQPETRHTVPGLLPASAASKRRDFPKVRKKLLLTLFCVLGVAKKSNQRTFTKMFQNLALGNR